MPDNTVMEAMKMGSNQPQTEELFNLEKSIKILETPFSEVCRVLGLDETEPEKFLEVGSRERICIRQRGNYGQHIWLLRHKNRGELA